jgi:sarcosine oxidase subunit alpha
VLAAVGTVVDLSAEAFPHMTYRAGTVAGVPARIDDGNISQHGVLLTCVPSRSGADRAKVECDVSATA